MSWSFFLRAALSGVIIAAVATIAKRSPAFGALIASLPLISIMAMLWLWHDTHDSARMASHVEATFWYVLPSLPMFLLMPYLLRQGWSFWIVLTAGIATTLLLYGFTIAIAARFGVRL